MGSLLYIIAVVLIIGWLISAVLTHFAFPLVHAILVIAVIVFLFQFLTGRRSI